MIHLGDQVRLKSGGETGRIIRAFDHYAESFQEALFVIRLDAPNQWGSLLTTAWESECQVIGTEGGEAQP